MENSSVFFSADAEHTNKQTDVLLSKIQSNKSLMQDGTCVQPLINSQTLPESCTDESIPSKKLKLNVSNTLISSEMDRNRSSIFVFENVTDDMPASHNENMHQPSCTLELELQNKLTPLTTNDKVNVCDLSIESETRICPSVVDRYFTKRYEVNLPKGLKDFEETKCTNFNDVCVLRHSNKLCIITLAPSHPIIRCRNTLSVTEVSYKVYFMQ